MKPVVVLTTVGPDFDARSLARAIVEAQLAACVNIIDGVHSIYRWEGRVSADDEQLLVFKTVDERVDALRELLFSVHPYDVPELIVLPIESTSEAYGAWIVQSVTSG